MDKLEEFTDQEVAERLMGWTLDAEGFYLDKHNGYAYTGWGDEDRAAVIIEGQVLFPACRAFRPTSDIGAAWEVVQRVDREYGEYEPYNRLRLDQIKRNRLMWEARWGGNNKPLYMGTGKSAPSAICRAALNTIGIAGVWAS